MNPQVVIIANEGTQVSPITEALIGAGFSVWQPKPGDEDTMGSGISPDPERTSFAVLVILIDGERPLAPFRETLSSTPLRALPRIGVVDDPDSYQPQYWPCQSYVSSDPEDILRAVRNLGVQRRRLDAPPSVAELSDMTSVMASTMQGPLSLASAIAYVTERLGHDATKNDLIHLIHDADAECTRIASILRDLDSVDAFRDGRIQTLFDAEATQIDLSALVRGFAKAKAKNANVGDPQTIIVAQDEPLAIRGHEVSLEAFLDRWWHIATEDAFNGAQVLEFRAGSNSDKVSLALLPPILRAGEESSTRTLRRTSVFTAPPGRDLSLSVIRALAELHGGTLQISFQPGGSTSYLVHFPALPLG